MRELRADNKSLREKMEQGHATLSSKLEKLSVDVSGLRGMQKAILWVIGIGMALWPILIATGKALYWF